MKVYEIVEKTTDIQKIINAIREGGTVDMDDVEDYLVELRCILLNQDVKEVK